MKKLFFISLIISACSSLFAKQAPNFIVTDYNNKVHNLYTDYLDKGKIVVVKIFFTTCPPCNAIAKDVQIKYSNWGNGTQQVQFIEMSNKSFDSNNSVKSYAQKHGITFPGVGNDGGALTALNPYITSQFGQFYGTPTFFIIRPDKEVVWDMTLSNLDSKIQEAILASSGGGGGGGGDTVKCKRPFSIHFFQKPDSIIIKHDLPGKLRFNFAGKDTFKYDCEFELPTNTGFYYIAPIKKGINAFDNVTSADIVKIQRHILSIAPITDPVKLVASDVTKDNKVSAIDISEIRKIILGKTIAFPGVPHYNYYLYDPAVLTDMNAHVQINPFIDTIIARKDVTYGFIKYGDVTTDYNKLFNLKSGSRTDESFQIFFDGHNMLNKQDIVLHSFQMELQFPNNYDGIIKTAQGLSQGEFEYAVLPNQRIRVLWYSPEAIFLPANTPLFSLATSDEQIKFTVNPDFSVAYNQEEQEMPISIRSKNTTKTYFDDQGLLHITDVSGLSDIQVFNLSGQEIYPQPENICYGQLSCSVNLSHLQSGIYIVKLQFLNNTSRIVKILK